jgi:hypothetical protein
MFVVQNCISRLLCLQNLGQWFLGLGKKSWTEGLDLGKARKGARRALPFRSAMMADEPVPVEA